MHKVQPKDENYAFIRNSLRDHGIVFVSDVLGRDSIEKCKDIINSECLKLLQKPLDDVIASNFAGVLPSEIDELRRLLNYYSPLTDIAKEEHFVQRLEILLDCKLNIHPVQKVRINVPRMNATSFPWHQDEATWPELRGSQVVTAWIALTPANKTNGMRFIKKTTKGRGVLFPHIDDREMNITEFDLSLDDIIYTEKFAPGDAAIFDEFCVHSTSDYVSGPPRLSLDLRYYISNR
ncbi:phytanoyl-CoA dioxygenase family protein [SAR116 cluster bacterium]|nr:phytanoyl-CoA dioxygenase family protein [SAR116 cluster bacterium]